MGTRTKSILAAGAVGAVAVGLMIGPVGAQSDDGERDDRPTAEEIQQRREEHRAEFAAALAEKLGVSVEDVEAALEEIGDERFEDRLAEAVESGRLTEEEADEMRDAKANGTLHELMQERRIERLAERLAQKVKDGDLTQEQADEILERAENGEFPGPRGHGGRRGPGGPGFGGPGFDGPGPDGDGEPAEA